MKTYIRYFSVKAEDDLILDKWLQKETKEQNEILSRTSNKIIHGLADAIQALPVVSFSVVTDGIKDFSGQQKESILLHYVDMTRFHKGHL